MTDRAEKSEKSALGGTWIPQVVIIGLLLFAFNPGNPYTYYIGLRWACFACFSFLAYRAYGNKMTGWLWVLAFVAILYNPFFRVRLEREIWYVVNGVTIGIAVTSIFAFKKAVSSKAAT